MCLKLATASYLMLGDTASHVNIADKVCNHRPLFVVGTVERRASYNTCNGWSSNDSVGELLIVVTQFDLF